MSDESIIQSPITASAIVAVTTPWREYQEKAADFFRSLGLDASTNVSIDGVRTTHDVDVLVRSHHAGFDVLWLIECKFWKTPVSKLHVLALREIVADTGADRGVLLSESGFQSGALEASNLTNVRLTSLAGMQCSASGDFIAMQLRDLFDRNERCRERYWNIPKALRIEHGLRPEVWGYSATVVIDYAADVLVRAFRGDYPFDCEAVLPAIDREVPQRFDNPAAIVPQLDPMLTAIEEKLSRCEQVMAERRSGL